MGMFARCREPRALPLAGVAAVGALAFPPSGFFAASASSSLRNCSLFMMAAVVLGELSFPPR